MQRILNNRQGIILGITGLFLLILVFYMLAVKPKVDVRNAQNNELTALQQQNDLLQSKIEERSEAGNDGLNDEQLANKLPNHPDAEQLILDIQRIGQQSSVRLSEATFAYEGENSQEANNMTPISQALSANGLRNLYVTVNVEGDYTRLRAWLDLLQQTERVVTVDAISFQQPAVPNTLLSATVTFTASYMPQATATEGTTAEAETDVSSEPAQ